MPNKSFSIYSTDNVIVEDHDQLVLEIGQSHLACLLLKRGETQIAAFELFNYSQNNSGEFTDVINGLRSESKILTTFPASAKIYLNSATCIPVPIYKFNKEIAIDYLDLVFGKDVFSKVQYEFVALDQGIMNVFKLEDKLMNYFQDNLRKVTFHHTYSNILKNIETDDGAITDEFIYIQFYSHTFVIAVLKEGKLQLIQTFEYDTTEDVLYHLLNITEQLKLYSSSLTVQICGLIDLDFQLYRELIKYFKNVIVRNVDGHTFSTDVKAHPLHYFTPFFNLAS